MAQEKKVIKNINDLPRLKFSDLEQETTGPVWVLNSSRGDLRGNVIVVASRPNSEGSDTLVIPATWIPVELTTLASRAQLISSNNFRITVSQGRLVLVDAGEAAEFMRTNKLAQAEAANLKNYDLVKKIGAQAQELSSDVSLPADKSGANDIPIQVRTYVEYAKTDYKNVTSEGNPFDEDKDAEWINKMLNLGDLEVAHYRYIWAELKGTIPNVAAAAKDAGRRLEDN